MIDVKRTSVKLPKDMLIKIKTIAVEKETTQNNVITELIAKGLKSSEKEKGKIKAKKVQMPFLDPNKKGNLKDMGGIVKIDDNIDVDEVINNIHMKTDCIK